MATYEALRQAMDHRMLAADTTRVAALAKVLQQLGHPEQRYHIIHLAGTNGKGSTGAWLAQGLRNAGYTVGHFHSPAMAGELDQTRLNDISITAAEFAACMVEIAQLADVAYVAFSDFEWDVLTALWWYAQQGVDWVVLEAGLGGAYDATNAISAPDFAVFTHIALDHTAILGPTVAAIAENKAQIIKPNTRVVVAPQQQAAALAVLKRVASAHHAQSFTVADPNWQASAQTWQGRDVNYHGHQFHLKQLGDYQLANAACAWLVWEQLGLANEALAQAMAQVQLPGRLQVIQQAPRVVLDAGHNPDALPKALATVRELLPAGGRLLVVAGFLKDKAVAELAQALSVADELWVTTPDHPTRALAAKQLQPLVPNSHLAADVHAGLAAAKAAARRQDVVMVAGSFYLIGALLDD